MKKVIWIGGLLFIVVLFSSYKTHYRYGVYIDDVKKAKQEQEKWCFYAVAQMAHGGVQCKYAEIYKQWKASQGEQIDTMYTCCQRKERCEGVDIDDAINFWNYLTKERRRYWFNISFYYTEDKGNNSSLPRLGLIDYHSAGGEYHAVWVFAVKIDVSYPSSSYKRIIYEVSYIDPETGGLDHQRNVGSQSCMGLSNIAIMES